MSRSSESVNRQSERSHILLLKCCSGVIFQCNFHAFDLQLDTVNWQLSLQIAQKSKCKQKRPSAVFELGIKDSNTQVTGSVFDRVVGVVHLFSDLSVSFLYYYGIQTCTVDLIFALISH